MLDNTTANCANVGETKQQIIETIEQHAPNKLKTFLAEYQKETGTETDVTVAVVIEELYKCTSVTPNRAVKQWLRSVLKNVNAETKQEIIRRCGESG